MLSFWLGVYPVVLQVVLP
ncbi:hypothetical protein [Aquimarina sp. 2201CG5-10]